MSCSTVPQAEVFSGIISFNHSTSPSTFDALLSLSRDLGREERRLAMLDDDSLDDAGVEAALLDSRVDPSAKRPSVEAVFHACLLTLPGVAFVAHTHPVPVNAILCSPRAADFARKRMFPDEIVCCGPSSVLIPYVDPGPPLARTIRQESEKYLAENGRPPRSAGRSS